MDPKGIKITDARFADMHRSGWDPAYRVADQNRDGVQAEFIYPTVNMLVCNHPDATYKNACSWAYNRWLETFVDGAPAGRIYGLGQIIMMSLEQAIADLRKIKDMGFKGVMMPGEPDTEDDYDQPLWDSFWVAVAEMNMPLSFHVLTGGMTKSYIEGRNALSGVKRSAVEMRATGRGPEITRSFGTPRSSWSASRQMPGGHHIICTAWTTYITGTATGRGSQTWRSCPPNISARTST